MSEAIYTILIVDDEKPTHVIVKNLLGDGYRFHHALNSQQAINLLSEKKIDLVLSDIHMPGMTGLEFLAALKSDLDKKEIPILIMTSLPSVEKEQTALDLGAKDFIDKEIFTSNPQELVERVEMKLVSNVKAPDLNKTLLANKKALIQSLMVQMESKDFLDVTQAFCQHLAKLFKFNHLSFWKLSDQKPYLMFTVGSSVPRNYRPEDLYEESVFKNMMTERTAYYSNNLLNSDDGIFIEGSREEGLPSEIGVPMFAISKAALIKNNMSIPASTPIFGFVLLKRSAVVSEKEFMLISKLLIQCSSILWKLYRAM